MKGPKTNDRCFPLPRRTGHGDFPPPALARVVSSRKHSQRLLFGFLSQLLSQFPDAVLS